MPGELAAATSRRRMNDKVAASVTPIEVNGQSCTCTASSPFILCLDVARGMGDPPVLYTPAGPQEGRGRSTSIKHLWDIPKVISEDH